MSVLPPSQFAAPVEWRPDDNPYVGPRPFEEQDAGRFFGREREARDLLALVTRERLTLFYAQSGAGKSSLLRARLIPALRGQGFDVLPIGRVSGATPADLARVDIDNIFADNLILSLNQGLAENTGALVAQPVSSSLLAYLGGEAAVASPTAVEGLAPTVLVIDQFEEIITTHPERFEERAGFFDQLRVLLERLPRLWIVLTLRADYVAPLERYAEHLPNRLRARYYMERMDGVEALEAIKQPALDGGHPFAPGAAETLVDNLRRVRVQFEAKPQMGQYVEPVQLQVVCYELWEKLFAHSAVDSVAPSAMPRQIQESDLPGESIDAALTNFYAAALAGTLAAPAVEAAGVSERSLRRWFNEELIAEGGIRNTLLRNEQKGTTGSLVNPAVDYLLGRYLLRTELRSGGAWVELVHDRFVEPIQASNRRWLLQHQHPLTQAAQAWKAAAQDRELLYSGRALQDAQAVLERRPDLFGDLEGEFLDAGQKEQDRRADVRRTQQRAGLFTLMVILLALTGWALRNSVLANSAKRDVEVLSRTIRAEQLTAKGARMVQTKAQLGLLLAIEGLRVQRDAGEAVVAPAQGNMHDLLGQTGGIPLAGHEDSITALAFSPDERWLATVSSDATARLWDMLDLQAEAVVLSGHEDSITALAFSPDGRWLATASWDATARLWNMLDPQAEAVVLSGHEAPVVALAFSLDGRWLATASWDATARLWDMLDLQAEAVVLSGHEDSITALAFSPDGRWLATASWDATARLWDMLDPKAEAVVLIDHEDGLTGLTFSPDGRWLATASDDNTARLWTLQTPKAEPIALRGHRENLTAIAYSPDGGWLVTAGEDGTVRLWTTSVLELFNAACTTVGRNLRMNEWQKYFQGELYHKTCAQWPIHSSILASYTEEANVLVREGEIAAALMGYQAYLSRVTDGDINASREISATVAGLLIEFGSDQAQAGDITGAVAKFEQAGALDPGLDIEAATFEARQTAAATLIEQATKLARNGDVAGATAKLEAAAEAAQEPNSASLPFAICRLQTIDELGDAVANSCAILDAQAPTVRPGSPMTGRVSSPLGDPWKLEIAGASQVTVTLAAAGSSLDPYLVLYDDGFQIIKENDDSENSLNSAIPDIGLTAAGTYWIAANRCCPGYDLGSVGSYVLEVNVKEVE